MSTADAAMTEGLSPLARGNRDVGCCKQSRCGSIPARTGEPNPHNAALSISGVYPRSHGGTGIILFGLKIGTGLSPLARGNLRLLPSLVRPSGSIPARTGEPLDAMFICSSLRVYPRSHGGTVARKTAAIQAEGLSPLARGNPRGTSPWQAMRGSIPARTGEPNPSSTLVAGERVYPRSHGGTRP